MGMVTTSSFAETAALVGDLARASMLAALMDGRALTATELARIAGITPQTASGHLARLTDAGLLAMERQGRHRYHRLASPSVARMIESIMSVASDVSEAAKARRKVPVAVGPRDKALRYARTCYDHLAGELAVAIADSMVTAGHVELSGDGGILTPEGAVFLGRLGIDLDAALAGSSRRRAGHTFCRPCLDWSERRPHIAGAVGTALCACFLTRGWIRRTEGTRAITVTPTGRLALARAFNLA
jgi:DNA-binding transcriptional ArsR family regulator